MDIKMMHEMIEKLTECAKAEMDKKGIEEIDAEEFGKVTDMIKDLSEAMYYRTVTVAMEEAGEENMGDEGRMYYRGQPRSRTSGRYISRGDGRRRRGYEEMMGYEEMEHMRDMDREGMGRMYYSGTGMSGGNTGGMRGYSESRSENARRGYEETKMMQDNSPEGKRKAMENLEKYMRELGEDITELVGKMDTSEKNLIKTKLTTLAQKIN